MQAFHKICGVLAVKPCPLTPVYAMLMPQEKYMYEAGSIQKTT